MKKRIIFIAALFSMLFTLITSVSAEGENKKVYFFKDYYPYQLQNEAMYQNGLIYVPADEISQAMELTGMNYNSETGEIVYAVHKKYIHMKLNSTAVTVFGAEHALDAPPILINNHPYVSLNSMARMVGAPMEIQDEGTHFNAIVSKSTAVIIADKDFKLENQMNSLNISSDTDYLIWVSKSEYKLRVFLGSKGNWDLIKEFTCAIGKDSTPTCTGQYKYYSKEKMWSYNKYYVGPIMRFNGGYAIHSTLLKYDGTPYDNRVGMKLSHGCVRLQPQDINWLVCFAPLYTTVYITE